MKKMGNDSQHQAPTDCKVRDRRYADRWLIHDEGDQEVVAEESGVWKEKCFGDSILADDIDDRIDDFFTMIFLVRNYRRQTVIGRNLVMWPNFDQSRCVDGNIS